MRALREQPRLAAARAIGAVCLVLVGIAIGVLLDTGDTDRADANAAKLSSAQQALATRQADLHTATGRVRQLEVESGRAKQRSLRLARANRALVRDLRASERARRRARSRTRR